MHFCASLLRISVVTKLSFVSAAKSQKHMQLNNKKIRSVLYVSQNVRSTFHKKKRNLLGSFFQKFDLSSDNESLVLKMADRWP